MDPLTLEELSKLSNSNLVSRMDLILKTARSERDSHYDEKFDLDPYVKSFLQTKKIQALEEPKQRKAIWMVFDFILQLEYVSRYSGFQNHTMDAQNYDLNGWSSPNKYIAYLSLEQASIVGSRIALERLIDLTYYVVVEKELPKDSSKFGNFKEWLLKMPVESDWAYLIPYLPWLREHDIEFRTAEVHSGSKLKKYLVALQDIPQEKLNDAMNLSNMLRDLSRELQVLFDNRRPTSGSGRSTHNLDWLKDYVMKDLEALSKLKLETARILTELN